MILETYKVIAEEKLVELAAKFNITPEEIKRLNPNTRFFKAFFGPEYVAALQDIQVPVREIVIKELKKEEREEVDTEFIKSLRFDQEARYRCEQTVITKINGILNNHADTKREFIVKKQNTEKGLFVSVKMVDNIIEAYQKPLEEAIKLVCEIDKVKCDVIVSVNKHTGKIEQVLNHKQIVEKWIDLKEDLRERYAFLRVEESKHKFDEFILLSENQLRKESNLINDLSSKLFFDVFFDRYLVTKDILKPYIRKYYSQLFDGYETSLEFRQDILSESPTTVELRKISEMDRSKLDNDFLQRKYNEKFKPMIKYQFSKFNFSVRERVTINTADNWIEQSEITIIEEVKNNIQVLITYKLTKIE
ncbi:hypothetical protein OIU83_22625 [Flavobacterium sp. LS1R49]|uniref:LysM domain-containing protein n=1 Tax=Flavobacterium shii TaxID=2987687 RepID=A0A9X2ZMN3_9FLAO|nr:hypothetical protein [Flavobacterium shii]MCV9930473.1 hypothetical protein [Flavobacterium shii]